MPDRRKQRRIADPAVQPERTSLAWFRTLLSCGVLTLLIVRHPWLPLNIIAWLTPGIVTIVCLVIYLYARKRNLMDVALTDFEHSRSIKAKLLIAMALFVLSVMLAATHVFRLLQLIH